MSLLALGCMWVHVAPGLAQGTGAVVGDSHEVRGSMVSGSLWGVGIPLQQLAWQGWSRSSRDPGVVWHRGVDVAGWSQWQSGRVMMGWRADALGSGIWSARGQVGMQQWPTANRRAISVAIDASFSQRLEWGTMRFQCGGDVLRDVSPGLPLGSSSTARGQWSVHWLPPCGERVGAGVPPPALGWQSGGQWWIEWSHGRSEGGDNANHAAILGIPWGDWRLRLEGPVWSFTLSWSGSLTARGPRPSFRDKDAVMGGVSRQEEPGPLMGVSSHQTLGLSHWTWFYAWSKSAR